MAGAVPYLVYATAALAMAALGVAVLLANPRSATNRLFAAFALLDGATTLVVIGSRVASTDETALLFSRVFWIYNGPLKSLLLYFALAFPTPSPILRRFPRALPALVLAPGLGAAVLFLVAPTLYVGPAVGASYYFGPLAAIDPFVNAIFQALAIAVLTLKLVRQADRPLAQRETALVLAALMLIVVPVSVMNVIARGRVPNALPDLLTFTAPTSRLAFFWGAVLAVAAASWAASRARSTSASFWEGRVVATAYAVALTASIALTFVVESQYLGFITGLASVAGVGLLGYGILKYQLFGLDVKLRRTAPAVFSILGIVLLFGGLSLAISPFDGGQLVLGVEASFVTAGLLTLAVSPAVLTATRHATARFVGDSRHLGGYENLKRIEVYRAALEKHNEAPETFTAEWVADLRDKLDLDPRDDQVVRAIVDRGAPVLAGRALKEGAVVMGKYRVESRLGEGGFGAAYLAHHMALDRRVVLKEVRAPLSGDAHALRALVQEARTAALLQHPNVVSVFDLEERAEGVVIVMEYCAGGSLSARLAEGPMTAPAVIRLLDDVLKGVEALGLADVVHRDLKPSNVLFDASGRAKLGDLGVALRPGRTDDLLTGTGLGAPVGTLAYSAPEVIRGEKATPQSDQFAVAALAYEALAGAHYVPLRGVSAFDLQRLIVEHEPDLSRLTISTELRGVLRRAFNKNATERFPDAGAMRAALRLVPEAREAWQSESLYPVGSHSKDSTSWGGRRP